MTPRASTLLVCPLCHGPLRFEGRATDAAIAAGAFVCARCPTAWPVAEGLPNFIREPAVSLLERVTRWTYDCFARWHDPAIELLLPILQGTTEPAGRDFYIERLNLTALRARPDRPLRILEVGCGTGANLPAIERALPSGLDVELWGLDLSPGMLGQCAERLRLHNGRPMHILLGDAHTLPFPDATFDRVFHTGGINGYRDPTLGVAEMARVAIPGATIVFGDEGLDPTREHSWVDRLLFHAMTLYGLAVPDPTAFVPAGTSDVKLEAVTSWYYCVQLRTAPDRR